MDEEIELYRTAMLIINIVLILLELGLAAVVILRFKATAAGIMLAAGFGGSALVTIMAMIIGRLMGRDTDPDTAMIVFTGVDVLRILLLIVVAIGVGFIPKTISAQARQ